MWWKIDIGLRSLLTSESDIQVFILDRRGRAEIGTRPIFGIFPLPEGLLYSGAADLAPRTYGAGTISRVISVWVRDRVNCIFPIVVCCWPPTGTLE